MSNIGKWIQSKLGGAKNPHASAAEKQQRKDYESHKYEANLASEGAKVRGDAASHQKAAMMHQEASRKAVDPKDKMAHHAKYKEHESAAKGGGGGGGDQKRDEAGKFA